MQDLLRDRLEGLEDAHSLRRDRVEGRLALENGGAVLLEDASLTHDLVEDDRGDGACLNQIAQDV